MSEFDLKRALEDLSNAPSNALTEAGRALVAKEAEILRLREDNRKLREALIAEREKDLGIDPGEDLAGRRIAKMPPEEVLERVLTWHGIIGYGEKVMRWVHVIEHAND